VSGEFVAAMEDVLELYAEADDPKRPRVNFDECSVELHKDVRPPEPAGPGQPARVDYEYERNGTANLFVVVDPHAGRRYVTVTERRTKVDFARQMKALCDDVYPDADRVRVVLDNLNTHTTGALYEAFEPAEARRLAAKLEFHYTPKHASWLNMAELELSVLARQCLCRRIPDAATLAAEVEAWQAARNRDQVRIVWCFKVADARKKMARVYPPRTPAADHYACGTRHRSPP
jgi:transposase